MSLPRALFVVAFAQVAALVPLKVAMYWLFKVKWLVWFPEYFVGI